MELNTLVQAPGHTIIARLRNSRAIWDKFMTLKLLSKKQCLWKISEQNPPDTVIVQLLKFRTRIKKHNFPVTSSHQTVDVVGACWFMWHYSVIALQVFLAECYSLLLWWIPNRSRVWRALGCHNFCSFRNCWTGNLISLLDYNFIAFSMQLT